MLPPIYRRNGPQSWADSRPYDFKEVRGVYGKWLFPKEFSERVVLCVDDMCVRLQLPETNSIVAPDLIWSPSSRMWRARRSSDRHSTAVGATKLLFFGGELILEATAHTLHTSTSRSQRWSLPVLTELRAGFPPSTVRAGRVRELESPPGAHSALTTSGCTVPNQPRNGIDSHLSPTDASWAVGRTSVNVLPSPSAVSTSTSPS